MKKIIQMISALVISALVVVFLIIISTVRGNMAANQEGINLSLDNKVEQSIAANQEGINLSWDDKVEQSIAEQERLKEEKYGKREEFIKEPTFYEQCYAKATEAQKQEIDKIVANRDVSLPPGIWIRSVKIVMGELLQNTPRLTVKEAEELYCNEKWSESSGLSLDEYELVLGNKFNKIAGAPDFVGGSGIKRSMYFLNDELTEAVVIIYGGLFHFAFDGKGSQPIVTQLAK